MSLGARLGAALVALLLPPVGGYLARGRRPGVWINLVLFCLSHGVFWGLAALPGMALYGLVLLQGLWLALVPGPHKEGFA